MSALVNFGLYVRVWFMGAKDKTNYITLFFLYLLCDHKFHFLWF